MRCNNTELNARSGFSADWREINFSQVPTDFECELETSVLPENLPLKTSAENNYLVIFSGSTQT